MKTYYVVLQYTLEDFLDHIIAIYETRKDAEDRVSRERENDKDNWFLETIQEVVM